MASPVALRSFIPLEARFLWKFDFEKPREFGFKKPAHVAPRGGSWRVPARRARRPRPRGSSRRRCRHTSHSQRDRHSPPENLHRSSEEGRRPGRAPFPGATRPHTPCCASSEPLPVEIRGAGCPLLFISTGPQGWHPSEEA